MIFFTVCCQAGRRRACATTQKLCFWGPRGESAAGLLQKTQGTVWTYCVQWDFLNLPPASCSTCNFLFLSDSSSDPWAVYDPNLNGVILKPWLSFTPHFQGAGACYWLYFQNLSRILPILIIPYASILVQATTISSPITCDNLLLTSLFPLPTNWPTYTYLPWSVFSTYSAPNPLVAHNESHPIENKKPKSSQWPQEPWGISPMLMLTFPLSPLPLAHSSPFTLAFLLSSNTQDTCPCWGLSLTSSSLQ